MNGRSCTASEGRLDDSFRNDTMQKRVDRASTGVRRWYTDLEFWSGKSFSSQRAGALNLARVIVLIRKLMQQCFRNMNGTKDEWDQQKTSEILLEIVAGRILE